MGNATKIVKSSSAGGRKTAIVAQPFSVTRRAGST